MAAFFYWLLNMSITAAFTGLVVILIRKIRIIPRRFMHYSCSLVQSFCMDVSCRIPGGYGVGMRRACFAEAGCR